MVASFSCNNINIVFCQLMVTVRTHLNQACQRCGHNTSVFYDHLLWTEALMIMISAMYDQWQHSGHTPWSQVSRPGHHNIVHQRLQQLIHSNICHYNEEFYQLLFLQFQWEELELRLMCDRKLEIWVVISNLCNSINLPRQTHFLTGYAISWSRSRILSFPWVLI